MDAMIPNDFEDIPTDWVAGQLKKILNGFVSKEDARRTVDNEDAVSQAIEHDLEDSLVLFEK
jgi:hypothetical protein